MKTYDMYTMHGSKCSGSFMFEGYNGPTEVSNLGNLTQNILQNTSSSVSALTPVVCGLHKGVETLASGKAEDQIEKDRTVWPYVNPMHAAKTLSTSLKVSDFYGVGALTGAEGYTGTSTTDPDNEVFYEFWCARVSDDYPAETVKVVCYITVEYDVTFTAAPCAAQA